MPQSNVKKTMIGGQAIIEGIMMRGPYRASMVVRSPDGLVSKYEDLKMVKDKHPVLGWPIIRGVVNFVDSMRLGMKALTWSAEYFPDEEAEQAKPKESHGQDPSATSGQTEVAENTSEAAEAIEGVAPENDVTGAAALSQTQEGQKESSVPRALIVVSMVLGIALAIGMFMLLPAFLANLLKPWIANSLWSNLLEGGIRLVILLLYMIAVSRLKDIKRVFGYHGAEHKTIACYEAGEELTVENVAKFTRFHPRCGTSFLFTVVIISILVFSVVGPAVFPWMDTVWIRLGLRILLLPLVVALSYEVNRLVGKYDNWFTWILRRPGVWMQRLTTREPDASMMEVGIMALEMVLPEKEGADVWGVNN